METDLRSIEVSMALPNIKHGSIGFFHCWTKEPFFDGSSNYALQKTFALIEFLDGSVKLMEPETIRFREPLKVS